MADAVPAGRSPDDRILDDHDLFADDEPFHRIELDPDSEVPHRLAWLDEGPPHVVVPDHPHLEGDPALFGVAEGRIVPRIGERHDEIHVRPAFPGPAVAEPFAAAGGGP